MQSLWYKAEIRCQNDLRGRRQVKKLIFLGMLLELVIASVLMWAVEEAAAKYLGFGS
jgi:hypothetical protein